MLFSTVNSLIHRSFALFFFPFIIAPIPILQGGKKNDKKMEHLLKKKNEKNFVVEICGEERKKKKSCFIKLNSLSINKFLHKRIHVEYLQEPQLMVEYIEKVVGSVTNSAYVLILDLSWCNFSDEFVNAFIKCCLALQKLLPKK